MKVSGFEFRVSGRPRPGEPRPPIRTRIGIMNRSSRRKEALISFRPNEFEPPYVGCYEGQVHGEVCL